MKAQEVRLGNYVDLYGSIATVRRDDFNGFGIAIDKGKPIPLTEDWLTEFGLTKRENQSSRYKYLNGFWDFGACYLYNMNDGSFTLSTITYSHEDEIEICTIEYVHSLQNLYYDHTGKELVNETIKT